jgi:hypothetical protein
MKSQSHNKNRKHDIDILCPRRLFLGALRENLARLAIVSTKTARSKLLTDGLVIDSRMFVCIESIALLFEI